MSCRRMIPGGCAASVTDLSVPSLSCKLETAWLVVPGRDFFFPYLQLSQGFGLSCRRQPLWEVKNSW